MRVLVGTDLSEAADLAVREGDRLASDPTDALAVVHVLTHGREHAWRPGRSERRAEAIAQTDAAVEARMRRLCRRRPEIFLEQGLEPAAITRRAERWKADVIVVAAHGGRGASRHLGRVAAAVASSAPCNVLVVRPGEGTGWVLAAVAPSDGAVLVLRAASAEADRRKARLEVVHAIGFLEAEAQYLVGQGSPVLAQRSAFEAAERQLAACIARADVDAPAKLLDGPAARAVVREADTIGAELIVVGSRGASRLARLVRGSVSEDVTRSARCSVLVVHTISDRRARTFA